MFTICLRTLVLLSVLLPGITGLASESAPLLKGKISAAEPTEINIVYDYQGDNYLTTFMSEPDGSFVYDEQLPVDETEVMIYINGQPYGAYVKKGTTTIMNIDGQVDFSGDNVAESQFFNAYSKAFYPMNYKPSPDVPYVFADYKTILDNGAQEVNALLPAVKPSLQPRMKRMTDTYYKKVLLTIYGIDTSMTKADHEAEMNKIIESVDPNADESRLTGILNYWYNKSDLPKSSSNTGFVEYMVDQYAAIDSALTNEGNKKALWNSLGTMLMMYRLPDEDVNAFLAGVEPQLAKAPMVKKNILEVRESMIPKIKDGDAVPTDPVLIAPDGAKIKLSDLLGKTVVYIDIWATWCAPCCREIPFLEKVVEHFKDNPAISFISISRDDNKQAWLKKLDRDKPEWPQYIFDKTSGDEFMKAMSISGIPRFLLIGKDGKFISTDAERPSNEKIIEILDKAISDR